MPILSSGQALQVRPSACRLADWRPEPWLRVLPHSIGRVLHTHLIGRVLPDLVDGVLLGLVGGGQCSGTARADESQGDHE